MTAGAGSADPPALPDALPARTALTDRGAVLVAAGAVLGAWWHRPVPVALVVALVLTAGWVRRPLVLVPVVAALASLLGQRAWDGLTPVPAGRYQGAVTLVADPQPTPYGVRADVRVGRRRVELRAAGGAAGAVDASLAGERLAVDGRLAPPRPGSPWLVPRHIVGRLTVRHAERLDAGSVPWRAANRLRRLLERGAEPLDPTERSLYLGFVLGDDRDQPPEVVDDFRGAGLTHVLVVSGQNVAYVLALAAPVLRRLAWRGRWALTCALIGSFALVTRFEPSVLRATAMAALAVTASAAGRPVGSLRSLSLAVAALVLVDPLLVWSVGFQLSTAASLAILLVGGRVAAALPGPRPLADVLGVTIAAQIGVAPILVPRFGGLPVVALGANVLAVPVAGLVTSWGLPAGVLSGLLGPEAATLLQLPTRLLIRWVATVARVAASLPLGEVGLAQLLVLGAVGTVAVVARAGPIRRLAALAAVLALLAPAVALRHPPVRAVAGGAEVQRSEGFTRVRVPAGAPPAGVLEGLRRAGVRRIDELVVTGGEPGPLTAILRHRWEVGRVVEG